MSDENKPVERSSMDDVIDVYKKDVDITLIREALKITPDEMMRRMQEFLEFAEELQRGMKEAKEAA